LRQHFGCFSKQKILNKFGEETDVVLALKATSFLKKALKTEGFEPVIYYKLFNLMPIGLIPNQEFFRWISHLESKKVKRGTYKEKRTIILRYDNLELLIKLEEEFPGIFATVMSDFERAKGFRKSINEEGKPTIISWKDALIKFFVGSSYTVTKGNEDLALEFAKSGTGQDYLDLAVKLRMQAAEAGTPEHILGVPLKEPTIMESIEKIRRDTSSELAEGAATIAELQNRHFTYEWLGKNDPENFLLWCFTSCCGTLLSSDYSGKLARAAITAPDVQSIVIRDKDGKIISGGTMYVNREARICCCQ